MAIGQARQWRPVATLALGALLLTHALSWSRLIVSHEDLQLHGVLLLGLTWLIQRRSAVGPWCLLCGASLGIHAYYTPMLLAMALVAQLSQPPVAVEALLSWCPWWPARSVWCLRAFHH